MSFFISHKNTTPYKEAEGQEIKIPLIQEV